MGWLEGYVAIITGGASGIGRAVMRRYLREGARGVVVVDRDTGALDDEVRQQPDKLLGVTFATTPCTRPR
jgi:2,3-dihydroxy-2,3-dihydrophenylpropionate dehydrogenase